MNNFENYKHFSVPQKLLKNYQIYNLSEKDFIDVCILLSFSSQCIDVKHLTKDKLISRNTLSKLTSLNIIELKEIDGNICVDISKLYELLHNSSLDEVIDKTELVLDSNQLDRFNLILNRNMKSYEVEQLNDWINKGYSFEQIELAIQKSVVNGVDNFKYVNTVLENNNKKNDEENISVVEKNFNIFD